MEHIADNPHCVQTALLTRSASLGWGTQPELQFVCFELAAFVPSKASWAEGGRLMGLFCGPVPPMLDYKGKFASLLTLATAWNEKSHPTEPGLCFSDSGFSLPLLREEKCVVNFSRHQITLFFNYKEKRNLFEIWALALGYNKITLTRIVKNIICCLGRAVVVLTLYLEVSVSPFSQRTASETCEVVRMRKCKNLKPRVWLQSEWPLNNSIIPTQCLSYSYVDSKSVHTLLFETTHLPSARYLGNPSLALRSWQDILHIAPFTKSDGIFVISITCFYISENTKVHWLSSLSLQLKTEHLDMSNKIDHNLFIHSHPHLFIIPPAHGHTLSVWMEAEQTSVF